MLTIIKNFIAVRRVKRQRAKCYAVMEQCGVADQDWCCGSLLGYNNLCVYCPRSVKYKDGKQNAQKS